MTTTAKHTPGPWYRNGNRAALSVEIRGNNAEGIGEVYGWACESDAMQATARANAALIIAAPRLLAAMSRIVEIEDGPGMAVIGWTEAMAEARLAIAAASIDEE